MRGYWAGLALAALVLSAGVYAAPFLMSQDQAPERRQLLLSFPLWMGLPHEISGWKQAREDQVFIRDNIFDYMDGAGEIYLAFNFQALYVREFAKPDAPSIVVEIYQMSSAGDAFGVFTQDTDGEEVGVGQDAIYAGGLLRFWKDNIFIRILADKETTEAKSAVMELGGVIEKAILHEGKKPGMLTCLPEEGLRPGSLRYFHTLISLNSHYFLARENILNLSPDTEAVLARYEKDNERSRLLFIKYPSREKAQAAWVQFAESYLKIGPLPEDKFWSRRFEDGKFRGALQKDKFLILVLEAETMSLCAWLADEISQRLEEKQK